MSEWKYFMDYNNGYEVTKLSKWLLCSKQFWTMLNSFNSLDHVYFVHPSTNISVDISSNTRPTLDQCISRQCRPICQSTYWPTLGRCNDWEMLVDVSTDVSTEISPEWWSTYLMTVGRYLCRYSGRHSADTQTIDCLRKYRSTVGGISVKNLDCHCQIISYTHFILFWSTSFFGQFLKALCLAFNVL